LPVIEKTLAPPVAPALVSATTPSLKLPSPQAMLTSKSAALLLWLASFSTASTLLNSTSRTTRSRPSSAKATAFGAFAISAFTWVSPRVLGPLTTTLAVKLPAALYSCSARTEKLPSSFLLTTPTLGLGCVPSPQSMLAL